MRLEAGKTRILLTFPFAAVIGIMLLVCDSEIVFASLFSSLFHEGGHLLFMLWYGQKPSLICFGAFGIRIEKPKTDFMSSAEAVIALGGVAGNLVVFICALVFYCFYESSGALKLMAINLFIALFNMLPVRALDFGRFLECLICRYDRGERILSAVSLLTALVIVSCSVLYNIFVSVNVSMIAVSIYIILITTLKE